MKWNNIELPDKDVYFKDDDTIIYCADCREILPLLPDKSIDLVLTDPPYGVGYKYGDAYSDTGNNYDDFARSVFDKCLNLTKVMMITTGMYNLWLYPKPTWVLCWAKPGSTRRNGLGGFNEWEPVLVYGKTKIYNDFKLLPDCVNHSLGYIGEHPCPKPTRLYDWLISEGSQSNDLILDPFLGSGTTVYCAKKLGRKCIGIEIEEKYCKIAVERLRQSVMKL